MTAYDGNVLGMGSRMLHRLRGILERDLGENAPALLQEAGYAAGDELYDAWTGWLAERTGVSDPAALDAQHVGPLLGEFFAGLGWGHLRTETLGAALAVVAADWAEADPHAMVPAPACHVTAGVLAGLLGRLAGEHVAVMEVECRSRGDAECRFLAGAAETLQAVYDGVNEGRDYRAVLGG